VNGVHLPLPRVLVGIVASEIRDGVTRAASNVTEVVRTVGAADDVADMLDSATRDFDIAIVDLQTIRVAQRRLRRERPELVVAPATIILVLRLDELREALALLHLCQGIVFWDEDPVKLSNMIGVAIEGYSAAPMSLLPDLVTDRVRVGLIERLTPIELQALELLGDALSNRAIAHELGISEPVAKSLVRTVLTKLRLRNRTEAAVLVARWRNPIEVDAARDLSVSETS
jgi:DNA-binding NarL/FixJ family response regulator